MHVVYRPSLTQLREKEETTTMTTAAAARPGPNKTISQYIQKSARVNSKRQTTKYTILDVIYDQLVCAYKYGRIRIIICTFDMKTVKECVKKYK